MAFLASNAHYTVAENGTCVNACPGPRRCSLRQSWPWARRQAVQLHIKCFIFLILMFHACKILLSMTRCLVALALPVEGAPWCDRVAGSSTPPTAH